MIDARINWDGGLVGGFTFGRSTFGGTDPFTSAWSASFDGVHDDLSEDTSSASWGRGRNDLVTTMLAGQASLTVVDPGGTFNPANPSSPLAGKLIPMRPAYIRMPDDAGVMRGCFRGFLRDEPLHDASTIPATTSFQLVDMFIILQGAFPTIASTGPTTTGAAIGKILDSVGLTDTAFRNLADGDLIPDFSADGTVSALDLIGALLEAERGMFFIDGDGVATYFDRHNRYERSPTATVDGVFSGQVSSGGSPIDNLINRQNVTGATGLTQQYVDNNSVLGNGPRDGQDITSPYVFDADQAAALARQIVGRTSTVKPLSTLQFASLAAGMDPGVLYDIGDLITIPHGGAGASGTEGAFYIEQLQATYQTAQLTTVWTLSKQSFADMSFRFGLSEFASTDPFRY